MIAHKKAAEYIRRQLFLKCQLSRSFDRVCCTYAYYLKYQNMRPSYIAAFWDVVDWDAAEANYQKAKA